MRVRQFAYGLVALLVACLALFIVAFVWFAGDPRVANLFDGEDTYDVELTDYQPPAPKPDDYLVDDQLSDKNPTFIPRLRR